MIGYIFLIFLVVIVLTAIGKAGFLLTLFTPSKPQNLPIGLTLVCSLVFAVCFISTMASAEDAYGYKGNYDQRTYKGGDLFIVGYGMYGYPYGSRMGSRGNRGYMGGGLRGGK